MLIDLFKKDEGWNYLQEIYNISPIIIEELRNSLYRYNEPGPMMTEKEADIFMASLCFEENAEEREKIRQNLIMEIPPYWDLADDAIETFLKKTKIKLDDNNLSSLRFRCIHVSPSIDDGQSIKKQGLLRLNELLEMESPLSLFLNEYGIVVKPTERWYSVNGEKHPVDGTDFAIKLYSFDNEIEAHIGGRIESLKDYSCLEYNPEFLRELSPLCGIDLQTEWKKRKTALLYVSFYVSFDECANITKMSCMEGPDNFERLSPYIRGHYSYKKEPNNIWRNLWLIDSCLENACPDKLMDLSPMAVRSDVRLDSSRVQIMKIE